ncbi:MAG: agmatinase [Alphaproteobacteria bacterium]
MTQNIELDEPLFEHLGTFLGLPAWTPDAPADVAVQGIPFDLTTPGRPGARFGPGAIRLASANLRWDRPRWPWRFELADRLVVRDAGDVHNQTGVPDTMVTRVVARTAQLLEHGARVLTFGGDHYVSLPLLRAHALRHGKMALLHFDSHTDTYDGPEFDNGTPFHFAAKEGLIDPEKSIQIGIRTVYDPQDYPYTVLDADWCCNHGPQEVLRRIREVIGDSPAYLTFDIDGLDPAFAPGTGTPVVGGFSTNFALQVLRGLGRVNVVGMDIVEVAPPYDIADITSLAAATLALEMLHVWADGRS